MTDETRPRFEVEALRELAGDKVFARGEAYHRAGQVEILAVDAKRVVARVSGTEVYRTELTGRGREIGCECSCPAFEDRGVCKHMVATALATNAIGRDGEAEGAARLSRIRAHLKARGTDALIELVVDLAERDPVLFRKLDAAAAVLQADDGAVVSRLRQALEEATRTHDFIGYHEAGDWANGVDAVLDALSDLAGGHRAALALDLAERALDRIEAAINDIDDSAGHCGALLHRARDIHRAAARAARPEPVRLARDLFAREMDSVYDVFYDASATYADVLGSVGLAEYRRLAAEAWEKLPPLAGDGARGQGGRGSYDKLARVLDAFAEREGDIDARIALRAKDLSAPSCYLRLAEFCLGVGREDEALRRAEEGLWTFEDDRPSEKLVDFVVEHLARLGRVAEAEAHLWRAFGKAPSAELYAKLRKLGGEAARTRALALLAERIAREKGSPWLRPADLLVRVLTGEKLFDAAWTAVRRHGASIGVREALAAASEATHPQEALAVYTERVGQLVEGGSTPSYQEAASLIARMGSLRGGAEQAAYVNELKAHFGRKRNFMKLLR